MKEVDRDQPYSEDVWPWGYRPGLYERSENRRNLDISRARRFNKIIRAGRKTQTVEDYLQQTQKRV